MTLGDVLALVAGVGAAFAVVGTPPVNPFARADNGRLPYELVRFLQGTSLALSCVTLARVGLHRRPPSAAEWIGFLVGGSILLESPWLDVDGRAISILMSSPMTETLPRIEGLRRLIAGLFLGVVLFGLGLLHLGRRVLPAWVKALVLTSLAILALAGPIWDFEFEAAGWIAPLAGFGPDVGSYLGWKSAVLAIQLPSAVLFGVPAVVALDDRLRRRRWTWAEWASAAVATMTGTARLLTYRSDHLVFTIPWLLEWSLLLGWLAAVVLLSRLIASKLGGCWQRWIGLATDQERPALTLDSDSSTR